MFAHRLAHAAVRRQLTGYAAAAAVGQQELADLIGQLVLLPKAAFARSTALCLLRVAEARQAWVTEVFGALPANQIRIDPGLAGPRKAVALFRAPPRTRKP